MKIIIIRIILKVEKMKWDYTWTYVTKKYPADAYETFFLSSFKDKDYSTFLTEHFLYESPRGKGIISF